MTDRSIAQSGLYSSLSTWVGGIKPSAGDRILNPGFTLTFDENTPVLGAAAADDDTAIVGTGAAQFIVAAGITVQCDGSWLSGDNGSGITVNNNSVIDMQSDYANNIALGNGVYNVGTFDSSATAGNWATVKSTGTTKTEFRCVSDEDYYNEMLSGSYVKLESIGTVRCQYACTIDHWIIDCESFTCYVSMAEDRDFEVDNCSFTNTGAAIANPCNAATTGARSFNGNVIRGYFYPSAGHAFDYEDCYFGGSFEAGTGYKGTFTRCVFTTGQDLNNFETELVDSCLFTAPNNVNNPHFCAVRGINPVIKNCIFESFSPYNNGDCILLTGTASTSILTARNNIVLPNSASGSSGTLITGAGNVNESVDAYNNTSIGWLNVGETYTGHVGQVRNFFNNLIYGASSKHLNFQGGDAVDGIVENTGNCSAFGITDPWQFIAFSAKFQSAPGTNDLNTDPQFFDSSRDFASWGVDVLGSGGGTEDAQRADATAAMLAINETDNANYNADATPANFSDYIHEGFTPQNLAYATAGEGVTFPDHIGAVVAEELTGTADCDNASSDSPAGFIDGTGTVLNECSASASLAPASIASGSGHLATESTALTTDTPAQSVFGQGSLATESLVASAYSPANEALGQGAIVVDAIAATSQSPAQESSGGGVIAVPCTTADLSSPASSAQGRGQVDILVCLCGEADAVTPGQESSGAGSVYADSIGSDAYTPGQSASGEGWLGCIANVAESVSPASVAFCAGELFTSCESSDVQSPAPEIFGIGEVLTVICGIADTQTPGSHSDGQGEIEAVIVATSADTESAGQLVHGTGAILNPERVIPLITELDGFEVVRDKIAQILALETVVQQNQAAADGLDPEGWRFLVYRERLNPWERYIDGTDRTPFVNVWYQRDNFDKDSSNITTRQATESRINVDCFACAVATETEAGHIPSDEGAALASQRVARHVRRIIMHDKYALLGLNDQDLIWQRWLGSRESLKPPSKDPAVQQVAAMQLAFVVKHNEVITLEDDTEIDLINVNFKHEPDGQVVAQLRYEV